MNENQFAILNHFLSYTSLFFLIGFLLSFFFERKALFGVFFEGKEKKTLLPLGKRLLTLPFGLFLIYFSFLLTVTITSLVTPLDLPDLQSMQREGGVFWSALQQGAQHLGAFIVTLFVFSGVFLLLSGGGKCFITIVKRIFIVIFFLVFFGALLAYA